MKTLRTLALFGLGLSVACTGSSTPVVELDATSESGCNTFLSYDAGAVGTAGQVLTVVTAAANAWKPGLSMVGLQGRVSPDGSDVDGGWIFTFGSQITSGLATVQPFATQTIVAGDCDFRTDAGEPSIRNFRLDSSVALAIAADAGCVLGPTVPVRLVGISNSSSPLFEIDPAWLISGSTVDGGPQTCIVDADTGAFGLPVDGGTRDAG